MYMLLLVLGCGRGDLYAPCGGPEDCPAPQDFEPVCLDKGGDGFCTWACDKDEECDFDGGDDGWERVCASFEDDGGTHCFPSCNPDAETEDAVCPAGFNCRSTGGGSDNRKVCFPVEVDGPVDGPEGGGTLDQ